MTSVIAVIAAFELGDDLVQAVKRALVQLDSVSLFGLPRLRDAAAAVA